MSQSQYQSEFERLFTSELERQRELVTDAIHNLLNTKVPPALEILLLESHSQWYSFPVYVFALDKKGQNETYFRKPFSGLLVTKKRKLVRDRGIDQDFLKITMSTRSELDMKLLRSGSAKSGVMAVVRIFKRQRILLHTMTHATLT